MSFIHSNRGILPSVPPQHQSQGALQFATRERHKVHEKNRQLSKGIDFAFIVKQYNTQWFNLWR
jgi:hypothetical protein